MALLQTDPVDVLDLGAGAVGAEVEPRERAQRTAPRHLRRILVASDIALSLAAWAGALSVTGLALDVEWLVIAASGVGCLVLAGGSRGLYLARVSSVRSLELAELLLVCALAAAVGTLVAQVAVSELAGEAVVLIGSALVAQFLLLAAGRSVFDDWLRQHRVRGEHCRRVVLIGYDDGLAALCETLRDHPETGYRIVGYFGPRPSGQSGAPAPERLGGYADAVEWMAAGGASGAIVGTSAASSSEANGAVRALLRSNAHVQLAPGLAGIDYRRVRTLPLAHQPLLYIEHSSSTARRDGIKRAMDLVLAPAILLLASPILLVAAVAVKVTDRGPVFYGQERIGRHGQAFKIWKLRTMVVGADAHREGLEALNGRTGPLFKAASDPRVTAVGRVLRVLSIDELPQLWNVIVGQMTLVGPRPALASEVDSFDPELLRRHDVVPGITGLWQVEARDNPSFGAYRRLDLFYVDNWSVPLDLVIIILTAHVVAIRALRSIGGKVARLWRRERPAVATRTLDG